jgi:lactoylglutathione lyase
MRIHSLRIVQIFTFVVNLFSRHLSHWINGIVQIHEQSRFHELQEPIPDMYPLNCYRAGRRAEMKYLHTMVRVTDLDESLSFYCDKLGLVELRRKDVPAGRFTLVFLAAPGDESAQVELTWNWDPEEYSGGRNFGHLAYAVDDIYALCQSLMDAGVTINRPPRDGHMAFVRSPDGISIELLQTGDALAVAEPWASMENQGSW